MVVKLQAIEYNFDIVSSGDLKVVADPYMTGAFIV